MKISPEQQKLNQLINLIRQEPILNEYMFVVSDRLYRYDVVIHTSRKIIKLDVKLLDGNYDKICASLKKLYHTNTFMKSASQDVRAKINY